MKKIILSMAMAILSMVFAPMVSASPAVSSAQTPVSMQAASSANDVIIIIIDTPDEVIIIVVS